MKKEQLLYYIGEFLMAVPSGVGIGIGGVIYLSLENKIIGALMFTIGLCAVCMQGLNLYTGKVGYLPDKGFAYLFNLLLIWCGNLCGTLVAAELLRYTRISGYADKAGAICQVKLDDGYRSLFILGVFCGMLMFVAVDGYIKTKNLLILFLGVATFILCGFEHCIADMFYFSAARMWSELAVMRILVITLGNSVGGLFIPVIKKISIPKEPVQKSSEPKNESTLKGF